jgi:hypothetical protein
MQNHRDEMVCCSAADIDDVDESDVVDGFNGEGDFDPEDTEFSLENRDHVNLDVFDESEADSGCDEELYASDIEE